MSLQISRTDAKINIETTRSELSIQTRRARLELSHKVDRLDIQSELPKVVIDQYECFASSGLRGPLDLTRYEGQMAMQHALNYATRVSGEGDTLAAIENGGEPIADLAWQNGVTEHEFGLDYMPKASPRITIVGGGLQITPQGNAAGAKNGIEGQFTPGGVTFNYIPSQVKIAMEQYASISMRYVSTAINAFA